MFPDPTKVLSRREGASIPYMVRAGETVVVAGVWQAHTIINYANTVGRTGRVVFIEANQINVSRLRRLTAGRPWVTWVCAALWREEADMEFAANNGDRSSWDRLVAEEISPYPVHKVQSHRVIKVRTNTLDNILDELNIKNVDHVNLTINRAELAAIEGMTRIFQNNPTMRLYAATAEGRVAEMTATLNGLGFAVLSQRAPDRPSRMGVPSSTFRIYAIRGGE